MRDSKFDFVSPLECTAVASVGTALRDDMDCWKALLIYAMRERGETLDDLESITLSEEELAEEFSAGYGGTEGKPFTAWTAKTVYFPVCYDGCEWVGSVSRHPDGKPTEHQGGG